MEYFSYRVEHPHTYFVLTLTPTFVRLFIKINGEEPNRNAAFSIRLTEYSAIWLYGFIAIRCYTAMRSLLGYVIFGLTNEPAKRPAPNVSANKFSTSLDGAVTLAPRPFCHSPILAVCQSAPPRSPVVPLSNIGAHFLICNLVTGAWTPWRSFRICASPSSRTQHSRRIPGASTALPPAMPRLFIARGVCWDCALASNSRQQGWPTGSSISRPAIDSSSKVSHQAT